MALLVAALSFVPTATAIAQDYVYLPFMNYDAQEEVVLAAVEKIDVCHITGTYDFGDGHGTLPYGHVINIADPAYPAHIEHGDPVDWTTDTLADGTEVCKPMTDVIGQCPCWAGEVLSDYTIEDKYTIPPTEGFCVAGEDAGFELHNYAPYWEILRMREYEVPTSGHFCEFAHWTLDDNRYPENPIVAVAGEIVDVCSAEVTYVGQLLGLSCFAP